MKRLPMGDSERSRRLWLEIRAKQREPARQKLSALEAFSVGVFLLGCVWRFGLCPERLLGAGRPAAGAVGRRSVRGQWTTPTSGRMEGYFPNILLRTQDNRPVRFYDDLIKDKVVMINFMYARCNGSCPGTTENLLQVQRKLGARVGRDVFIYSISLDADHDTPAVLKEYAEAYGTGKGWYFLTGKRAEIELLRHRLGNYDPDPVIDADRARHARMITYGNEATGAWAAVPSTLPAERIYQSVLAVMETPGRSGQSP
jgi:protein SCO1/2